jgi:hypothetical protein
MARLCPPSLRRTLPSVLAEGHAKRAATLSDRHTASLTCVSAIVARSSPSPPQLHLDVRLAAARSHRCAHSQGLACLGARRQCAGRQHVAHGLLDGARRVLFARAGGGVVLARGAAALALERLAEGGVRLAAVVEVAVCEKARRECDVRRCDVRRARAAGPSQRIADEGGERRGAGEGEDGARLHGGQRRVRGGRRGSGGWPALEASEQARWSCAPNTANHSPAHGDYKSPNRAPEPCCITASRAHAALFWSTAGRG